MTAYNSMERRIAQHLRRFPKFKVYAKLLFQLLMYLSYKKGYSHKLYEDVHRIIKYSDTGETFFGYFAQSVEKNNRVIYHNSDIPTHNSPRRFATGRSVIQVVCSDAHGKELYRANTRAFNWQQGAKITWIDDDRCIYNDLDSNGKIVSKLVTLSTCGVEELPFPIYEVLDNSRYISLSFGSLTRLNPDYGYYQALNTSEEPYFAIVNQDGSLVHLWTMQQINKQLNIFSDAKQQCLNHASVSPDKSRVVLIHRSYPEGVRQDRLLHLDLNSIESGFSLAIDSGMVSHFDWLSDNQLICYMRYGDLEGYFVITFDDVIDVVDVDIPELKSYGDGHPARVSKTSFITDTYPNKARMKSLLYVDLANKTVKLMAEFFEPIKMDSEARCDLHPRYDETTGKVFIDSDHSGRRQLYEIILERKLDSV